MRRTHLLNVLVAILLVAGLLVPSAATALSSTTVKLWIGNASMFVNGVKQPIDAQGTKPVIVAGRTLVPIRAVIEAFDGSVAWDAMERKVTVSLGENTLNLWIGKSTASLDGSMLPVDSANPAVVPVITNGRTMLPLRFVAESLGIDVQYDATTKMITLTYSIKEIVTPPVTYTLTVITVGNGMVTPATGTTYAYGTVVTLTATPAAGYTFSGWSGDLSFPPTNPPTITMTGNKTVTATFAINTYALTVTTMGNGAVTPVPAGGTYNYGTVVTLAATPSTDYTFTGWSGDLSGATNPTTITMDAARAVTATFAITPVSPTDGSNLLLGNPSNAIHNSTSSPDNYLMDSGYYVLSYNRDRATPNWVSWYIGNSSLGSTDRLDNFRADSTLPAGWYQVQANSYSGSGFDRGHNCPSADRTSTIAANSSTFLMTNMIPQAPNNNQQTWNNFESYLRSLVNQGNEIYVVMGSYGTGGTGSSSYQTTIDGGHITVPAHIWKVAVVLSNGDGDLGRITTSTRVIAIDTPNTNSVDSKWQTYLTSVDAIEAATGYDLLSNVSVPIQKVLEAKVDDKSISPAPVVVVPPVPVVVDPSKQDIVYRTATGSKYHRLGCQYLKSSCIALTRAEAIALGLTPCSVCNP